MTGASRADPEGVRGLHVVADEGPAGCGDRVGIARAAGVGGAAVIQLRAKHASDRQVLAWGREIRALTRARGALFVMNDRFDLALLSEADGVHLGQEDLPPERIPRAARRRLLVGRSTHTLEQARSARAEPVDYVAFGPVFGTRSKESEYEPRGVEMLAEVVRIASPRPVVGIGGIDARNAPRVASAGACFAVIGAVAGAEDPVRATRELVRCAGPGRAA